jgi:hypothetical protein
MTGLERSQSPEGMELNLFMFIIDGGHDNAF